MMGKEEWIWKSRSQNKDINVGMRIFCNYLLQMIDFEIREKILKQKYIGHF